MPKSLPPGPLILLSPAKSLVDFGATLPLLFQAKSTQPQLLSHASPVIRAVGQLSKSEIKTLMGVSDAIATLNHQRFADFEKQPTRPAVVAFDGPAYKSLAAGSLDKAQLEYLQSSLRILCGLYGVLRPLDDIRPYRLEMSTKLPKMEGGGSLYAHWGDALTAHLNEELDAMGDSAAKFVLNVASQEYAKAVKLPALRAKVLTAQFPGPAVHAKAARGEIARFCAVQSDDSTYVFQRGAPAPPPKAPSTAAKGEGKRAPPLETSGARQKAKRGRGS